MRHIGAIVFAVGVFLGGGCADWQDAQRTDPETELAEMGKRLRELDAQLKIEKNKSAAAFARIAELVARDRELTDEIARLRLIKEQQEKQIETLKDAPAQRDAYKELAEQLTREVNKLSEKVDELERQAAQLRQKIKAAEEVTTGSSSP